MSNEQRMGKDVSVFAQWNEKETFLFFGNVYGNQCATLTNILLMCFHFAYFPYLYLPYNNRFVRNKCLQIRIRKCVCVGVVRIQLAH